MKLDPAGVEKAALILVNEFWGNKTPEELFTAALTTYFSHLRENGKMRELSGWVGPAFLGQSMLIIRTEKE